MRLPDFSVGGLAIATTKPATAALSPPSTTSISIVDSHNFASSTCLVAVSTSFPEPRTGRTASRAALGQRWHSWKRTATGRVPRNGFGGLSHIPQNCVSAKGSQEGPGRGKPVFVLLLFFPLVEASYLGATFGHLASFEGPQLCKFCGSVERVNMSGLLDRTLGF